MPQDVPSSWHLQFQNAKNPPIGVESMRGEVVESTSSLRQHEEQHEQDPSPARGLDTSTLELRLTLFSYSRDPSKCK